MDGAGAVAHRFAVNRLLLVDHNLHRLVFVLGNGFPDAFRRIPAGHADVNGVGDQSIGRIRCDLHRKGQLITNRVIDQIQRNVGHIALLAADHNIPALPIGVILIPGDGCVCAIVAGTVQTGIGFCIICGNRAAHIDITIPLDNAHSPLGVQHFVVDIVCALRRQMETQVARRITDSVAVIHHHRDINRGGGFPLSLQRVGSGNIVRQMAGLLRCGRLIYRVVVGNILPTLKGVVCQCGNCTGYIHMGTDVVVLHIRNTGSRSRSRRHIRLIGHAVIG